MIASVGVVGAGTMGSGIAQVFAQAGYSVVLVDVSQPMLDRGRAAIQKSLDTFVTKGKMSASDRDAALGRNDINQPATGQLAEETGDASDGEHQADICLGPLLRGEIDREKGAKPGLDVGDEECKPIEAPLAGPGSGSHGGT